MGIRLRMVLLVFLALAATLMTVAAARSLNYEREDFLPEEIYADYSENAERAEYYLGSSEGYVAVFPSAKDKIPLTTTGIEVEGLRSADKAMLEKGIPVTDRQELLKLLEDLGS